MNGQQGTPVSAMGPAPVQPTAPARMMPAARPAPAAPLSQRPGQPGAPNVFDQSARWLTQAGQGSRAVAGGATPMVGTGAVTAGAQAYMNPYTAQVVDTTMGAMNRARGMAMDGIGADATAAGAFGGSRHGVAEAETNRAFADQAGQMAAGLYQGGYDRALGASMQQQGMNQQAALANRGLRLQGANQLGQMANLGFGMGMNTLGQQAGMGQMQQQNAQNLINAQIGQWGGFTGQPYQSLTALSQALANAPKSQSETTSHRPGLFDFMSFLPF